MSASEAQGRVRNPGAEPVGNEYPIPFDPVTGAVQVVLITGGGPLPFGSKMGSGTLVGAAVAVTGFAADVPNALAVTAIKYARGVGTTKCKLSVNVTVNTFVVAATTFEVFRNGVATGLLVTFGAGVVGNLNATANVAFGADVDTFDLRVTNPGNAGDVGKTIEFGFDVEFF